MKTVLLLGGPAAGQRVEVHGTMRTVFHVHSVTEAETYNVVPMCSHGEVHWFGVLDGADPLALLIAGYAPAAPAAPELTGDSVLAAWRSADDSIYGPLPLSAGLVKFIVDLSAGKINTQQCDGAKNGRMTGMHPALGMGYGASAPVRGDIYAEAAKDFSTTKNRDGECP